MKKSVPIRSKKELVKKWGNIAEPLVILESKEGAIFDRKTGYQIGVKQGNAIWYLSPGLGRYHHSRWSALQFLDRLCARMKKDNLEWDFGNLAKKG